MSRTRDIDYDLVIQTYEYLLREFGRSSCQLVADYLASRGYLNEKKQSYTRQAIWKVLRSTPEGTHLLTQTKRRVGRE